MLLDDLSDYLSSSGGVGIACSTMEYAIFRGRHPEAPDRLVVISEYGGVMPVHTMSAGPGTAPLERPRVQVYVRSPNYSSGRQKMNAAWKALDLLHRSINGVAYTITAIQSPIEMPRDVSDRAQFICNFQIMKSLST